MKRLLLALCLMACSEPSDEGAAGEGGDGADPPQQYNCECRACDEGSEDGCARYGEYESYGFYCGDTVGEADHRAEAACEEMEYGDCQCRCEMGDYACEL